MLIPKAKTESIGCLPGADNGTSKCTTCGAEQPPAYNEPESKVAKTCAQMGGQSEDEGKKEDIARNDGICD